MATMMVLMSITAMQTMMMPTSSKVMPMTKATTTTRMRTKTQRITITTGMIKIVIVVISYLPSGAREDISPFGLDVAALGMHL